jgi:hypothetical protein
MAQNREVPRSSDRRHQVSVRLSPFRAHWRRRGNACPISLYPAMGNRDHEGLQIIIRRHGSIPGAIVGGMVIGFAKLRRLLRPTTKDIIALRCSSSSPHHAPGLFPSRAR